MSLLAAIITFGLPLWLGSVILRSLKIRFSEDRYAYLGWAHLTGCLGVGLYLILWMTMGLPLIESMGLSLVWFGIVAVVAAEIGLLTPPLGLSCFVIKATLDDDRIKLKDVFLGALPFAFVMLLVLILLIRFPALSLAILN